MKARDEGSVGVKLGGQGVKLGDKMEIVFVGLTLYSRHVQQQQQQ